MASHVLVFGFGSLINSKSRARTLGEVPAWPVRIAGLRRAFNAPSDRMRHTALGVALDDQSACNGVLALLPAERIAALDAREAQYDRTPLSWDQVTPLAEGVPSGSLVTYVPRSPVAPRESHPVLRSYLDVTLSGCLEFGEDFARELLRTTDHVLPHLEDDRHAPRYPLHEAHAPRSALEALLAELLAER